MLSNSLKRIARSEQGHIEVKSHSQASKVVVQNEGHLCEVGRTRSERASELVEVVRYCKRARIQLERSKKNSRELTGPAMGAGGALETFDRFADRVGTIPALRVETSWTRVEVGAGREGTNQ